MRAGVGWCVVGCAGWYPSDPDETSWREMCNHECMLGRMPAGRGLSDTCGMPYLGSRTPTGCLKVDLWGGVYFFAEWIALV